MLFQSGTNWFIAQIATNIDDRPITFCSIRAHTERNRAKRDMSCNNQRRVHGNLKKASLTA